MLEIIKNFLEIVLVPPEEITGRRLRQNNLERIVQYCKCRKLDFIPEEVARFPSFAENANSFIEEKARKNLPKRQFDPYDRFCPRDISKYVETGGILGYDGEVFEISYSPPDEGNVRVYTRSLINPNMYVLTDSSVLDSGQPVLVISSARVMREPVKAEDVKRAEAIIHWHTHPQRGVPFSEGDADCMNWFCTNISDKPTYFVVFTPGQNRSIWYQAKRVSQNLFKESPLMNAS